MLRAWERRYGAVKPSRTAGGQRLYSESDVERLTLLRRAATAGHSIAEVATLDLAALEALIDQPTGERSAAPAQAVARAIADALEAAERLDRSAMEQTLRRFALGFGSAALVDAVIGPLLREVGERWHAGALSPAHEHLASKAVAGVLGWTLDAFSAGPRAPRMIVTTPAGEHHELGALLAAAAAAEEGWRVVYLGGDLPHNDIVQTARQAGARAVCLSFVNPDNPLGLDEILAVARDLRREMTLFVGGRAAHAHEKRLAGAGTRVIGDMPAFRRALRALRSMRQSDD